MCSLTEHVFQRNGLMLISNNLLVKKNKSFYILTVKKSVDLFFNQVKPKKKPYWTNYAHGNMSSVEHLPLEAQLC